MSIGKVQTFIYACLFVLINTVSPLPLLAQGSITTGVNELLRIFRSGDTTKVCKSIRKSLLRNREYLIEYEEEIMGAKIIVFTSDGRTDTAQSPIRFQLPLGPVRIERFRLKLPPNTVKDYPFDDSWQTGEITHIKLQIHPTDQTAIIPPPVKRVYCPKPRPGGILDKPLIPFPHKKLSIITASVGAIAGGTYLWFRNEKGNVEDHYEQYQKAPTSSQAVELRSAVENSRTRRNIAGAISFAASITFMSLLARDLFLRKDQSETCALIPSTIDSQRKFHLSLEPSTAEKGIKISMNMKL